MKNRYCELNVREIDAGDAAVALREVFRRACGWPDVGAPGHDILVSALPGAYEHVGGFAITINGSPSRGRIFVHGSDEYLVHADAARLGGGIERCSPEDGRVVLDFLRACGVGFGSPVDMTTIICRWQKPNVAHDHPIAGKVATSSAMIADWKAEQRAAIEAANRRLHLIDKLAAKNLVQNNAVRLAAKTALGMDIEDNDFDLEKIVMPEAALNALVTHAGLSDEEAECLFDGDEGSLIFIHHQICHEILSGK
ncbi:MAG TPA: hypothetical protein VKV04_02535 [Verrucomicrobiae bacterium]|nr:hypothetical protein [Verrucomicrobiae bacterium]